MRTELPQKDDYESPGKTYTSENQENRRRGRFKEKSMRFMFLFAKRFIAGENLEEAVPVISTVNNKGFHATADILGESVTNPDQAKEAADEYTLLLDALNENRLECNVSLKLTQLGLEMSKELCYKNVCKILEKAAEVDGFVRIDMEGSDTTDDTLELVHRWHEEYKNVGAVIQSMLKRSNEDAEKLIEAGVRIRLCKGAYKEPKTIAFKKKKDVNSQYAELAVRLLDSGIYHGIATHDEGLINHIKNYAIHHRVPKDSFEFQMLFGIRRKLQKDLLDEGWNVRIYIPYGDAWLPYTIRRLRERKENVWFVAKNLFRH